MATQLLQTPAKIAFSQNPNVIKLTSSDWKATQGTKAVYYIRFKSNIVDSVPLTLSWSSATLNFTAKAEPDDSGLQLPTGDLSFNYVNRVIDALKAQYYVGRDFDMEFIVYTGYTSIRLTAKEEGARYNIQPFENAYWDLSNATIGTDSRMKDNFAHHLQVWCDGKKIYESNLQLDFPFTGVTTKDIADVIHPYLDYDKPSLNTIWQLCSKSFKRYQLKFSTYYGETPTVKKLQATSDYLISIGGYSKKALLRINDKDNISSYLMRDPALYNSQKWFETWPIDNFSVKTNQPVLFYFVNNRSTAENLNIRVDYTRTDGTSGQFNVNGGALQTFQKVCINCGYQQLGLQNLTIDGSLVNTYSVTIVEAATSESRSVSKHFSVDREHEENTRYFLYSDSAGNFKTLHCTGVNAPTIEVTASIAQRNEDPQTPVNGNYSRYGISLVESDELNTGYLVADEQQGDPIQELMLARYAYRVFGNDLVPVIITSKKINPPADGNYLPAFKIEYRLAYDEKLYTGSSGAGIYPRPFTAQQPLNDI